MSLTERIQRLETALGVVLNPNRPQPVPESWLARDVAGFFTGPADGEQYTAGQLTVFQTMQTMDCSIGKP